MNPHIVVTRYGVYFSDYEEVADAIADIDGVESTAPFIIREMLVTREGSHARPGALIKGVAVDAMLANDEIGAMVVGGDLADLRYDGDLLTDANPDGLVAGAALGKVLAARIGAEVGDSLTLVSPLRGIRSVGIRAGEQGANFARVRVSAIVDSGFYDYDNRLIVMDYRAVQDLLGLGDDVMGIEVRVHDVEDTERVKTLITETVASGLFKSLDWREVNRNLFTSLQLQKLALTLVMSILVVVACSVILCVLVMLVLEKRREIAILRSMGATAGGIMRIFIAQGMAIGAAGTALGLLGGYVVCRVIGYVDFGLEFEVYRVPELPVTMRAFEFAATAVGALLICFVATLYPSWRAAQVSPIDALRYD